MGKLYIDTKNQGDKVTHREFNEIVSSIQELQNNEIENLPDVIKEINRKISEVGNNSGGSSLVIGVTTGTAYDGGKGAALERELQEIKDNRLVIGTETGTAYDGAAGATLEQIVRELAGGAGTMYSVYIRNNMPSLGFATQYGEKCELDFTFVSQYRNDISEPYKPTGENGMCTVMIKNAKYTDYTVIKQMEISSGVSIKLDVAEWLSSGSNSVKISVTGGNTDKVTAPVTFTVQLTSLGISAPNFAWWTAFTGNINIPMVISGNISKILHVTVTGENYNQSYDVNIGTAIYTDTAYNYTIPHPGTTGVYNVSFYLSNSDNTIQTRAVSVNVMCAVAGEPVKMIVINNIADKAVNWTENTLFEYSIYNGDEAGTSAEFIVRKDDKPVYTSNEDNITTQAKHTFSIPMEIDTLDNSGFNIEVSVMDGPAQLCDGIVIPVDNSLSYSAVPGAVFYMNPKTRNNSQGNRLSVINEITGDAIPGTWDGVNWGNDAWTTDAAGNKVLRIMAGGLLTIGYKPFERECARKGKTVEVDYLVSNVTDYSEPLITMSVPDGNNFIGLNIYADEVIMHSQVQRNDKVQSLHTFEGKRTRLALTIIPDAYGNPGFNLCVLYVNGVKNREFTYENNDYFAQGGEVVIGSDYADVDVYGIRIYDSGLPAAGILTNYINWLVEIDDKIAVRAHNDILDSNGSDIDFDNTADRMNVMVYDNTIPLMADQTQRTGTLEVFWHEHPEWNVSISNVTAKGQGTSSMKYWIWNTRYQLDKKLSVISYADGSVSAAGSKWAMTPYLPPGRKFTAKKNYASSMHSHKIGAVNSYTDLMREAGILNEAMQADEKVRVSVWEAPFVCFEKQINEEGETIYVFRGLFTFGPDKGDADTFGYNTDTYPNLLSIEGSDNSPLLTLFRVPWNPARGLVSYNEDEEAYQYNGQNCFDLGEGKVESISKFIPAYNCVYQCSPRLKPFNGTIDELNAQPDAYKNEPYEFWIAKAGDVNRYNVYYYESSVGQFIASDIGEGAINLKTQLENYLSGDLSAFTADRLNELFINARIAKFRDDAPLYWDIEDCLFFMNNVEFHAGTDERAKNTYPYSFGTDTSRFRWRVDDADTRFDTTNRGLPEKSYSVETHDKDETGAAIWNGETNNFFNLMELAFPEEKFASMRRMMAAMQTLGSLKSGNDLQKLYAFYQKYYFDVAQEYFPQNAYNADAKYCYEFGKLAYNGGRYTNDTDPITQSLGDHYLAEQRWITKRILYMMSKYSFGLFSANGTDSIVVRAAGNSIGYDITPAMDMYPAIANGTSIIRGARTKAGEVCHIDVELGGTGDQQNAIQAASYLQDIGDWHDKNVTGSMIIQGRMLRDIRLGHATENIVISITSLTLSNCQSLQRLVLSRISTLSGVLNLLACMHLQEVYAGGTSLTQIVLPEGGGLRVIEYSELNQYINLQNYPLLTNEGVLIDYCKDKITDFLISDCPMINPIDILSAIMKAQSGQNGNHALKRVRAVGFDVTYTDNGSEALDMLGSLVDGTYEGLNADGLAGEDPYPVLDGKITVKANTYEDTVTALRERFAKLTLVIDGQWYIRFRDEAVKNIVVSNWGDGTGITKEQAAAVTTLGDKFRGNSVITSFDEFELFTGMTEVGVNAFYQSVNLKSIRLPDSVKTIKSSAFNRCSLILCAGLSHVTSIEAYAFQKCQLGGTVNLSNCTSLGVGAFYQCSALEGIILNDSIAQIGGDTFRDCVSLRSINIPARTTIIGRMSFSSCKVLESVDLSNVSEIQYAAFQGCTQLKNIGSLRKVTTLQGSAFASCTSLSGEIDLSNCTILESYAFENCSITKLTLSNELTEIPRIFIRYCASLKEINIPPKITLIGEQAFSRCTGLESPIVLPAALLNIEGLAFANCTGVPYIKCLATTPPTLGMDVFYNIVCNIYVPNESVTAYKTAANWSNYASRIKPLSEFAE